MGEGFAHPELSLKGKLSSEGGLRGETSGLKVMERQSDFQWEPCALSQYITNHGGSCLFTPKFHPELNFIERAWGRAKWFLRLFCDYSYPGVKARLAFALGLLKISKDYQQSHERLKEKDYVLTKRLVQKYSRKSRDYVVSYLKMRNGDATDEVMKTLKSHRTTSKKENY